MSYIDVAIPAIAGLLAWARPEMFLRKPLDMRKLRLVRLFGIQPASEHEMALTSEDLQRLVEDSERGGTLDPEEAGMIEGVLELHETSAHQVMSPAHSVTVIPSDVPVRDALMGVLGSPHSRFPVVSAAGQAVATAHVTQHAYGGAYYALKAIAAGDPEKAEARLARELAWQARRHRRLSHAGCQPSHREWRGAASRA